MTPIRQLLTLIAFAFPCAPVHADSSDIPQWYGTITFTKTLAQHTTNPIEFQNQPGKKFSDVKVTWSGSIRFLPGPKSVVVASYSFRRESDRREDRMQNCHWNGKMAYHDYDNTLELTRVAVNHEYKSNLAFRLKPDGTYKVSVIVNGGNQVDKAVQGHTRREFYDECSKPNLRIEEQKLDGSGGMESLTLAHVEGTAKPGATTLTGNWKSPDDDNGELSYSWNLTLAEPQLVARAEARPGTVVRAGTVTLDAKASTGKIDKYEWQFTPDGDCQMTREGLALKLAGVSVTFKALCDFTAQLTVSNANASDRTSQPVLVEARKGEAWATSFKTVQFAHDGATTDHGKPAAPGPELPPITADLIHAGANQCVPHSVDITNHWLHTTAVNAKTWRDSGGYVLAQMQDSGPFKGAWYVQSQSLKVDRVERVNPDLLPGGTTYQLNSKSNLKDIVDWGVQVKAHEAAHSALVKEKLDMLGPDGDPAVRIEKLVGGAGEVAFNASVDFVVRDVETVLQEASLEDKVAERLRSEGRFGREIKILVPGSEFPKHLGLLWAIGHDPKPVAP